MGFELKDSPTLLAKNVMMERINKNLPVYNGGLGENPLPAPQCLQDEIIKYTHRKEYTSTTGIESLQKLLGTKLVVGNGSKELIFIIQLAFSKMYPNGCIFYLYPAWVSYMEQSGILGINAKGILTNSEYKIDPKVLDEELGKIYPNETMIIFNNPCNPTGKIYTKSEVNEIQKVFRKYGTIVFNDEIYKGLVHPQYVDSYGEMDKFYPERTINGNSLSKTFACGGYRLGWMVFPETNELDQLYKVCNALASSVYSCPSILLQYVAVKGLTYPDEIKTMMEFQREMFSELGEYVWTRFTSMNIICSTPEAAWYIWMDFSNYKEKLTKLNITSSTQLTTYLVETFGIVVVAGDAFGVDGLTCRYSYIDIDFDMDKKSYEFERIKDCMNILEGWLKE
jgi:aspartate aminotransferase